MTEASDSGRRHTIVLDWDGTLVPARWPEQPREWLPGAVEAMKAFHKAGFAQVVNSARLTPYDPHTSRPRPAYLVAREVQYIRSMLDDAGCSYVDIWLLPGKPSGAAYIDDKAYRYTGRKGSWKAMTEKILLALGKEEALFPKFDQEVASD